VHRQPARQPAHTNTGSQRRTQPRERRAQAHAQGSNVVTNDPSTELRQGGDGARALWGTPAFALRQCVHGCEGAKDGTRALWGTPACAPETRPVGVHSCVRVGFVCS